jgi:hypothetical protein
MQLKPFLLDAWIDQYEHDIELTSRRARDRRFARHRAWTFTICDELKGFASSDATMLLPRAPRHFFHFSLQRPESRIGR